MERKRKKKKRKKSKKERKRKKKKKGKKEQECVLFECNFQKKKRREGYADKYQDANKNTHATFPC